MAEMLFADPNVIYLLLLTGLWASVLGIYTPGTGVVETFAAIALIGAFIALATNPLTNWLAVILLGAGVMGYLLVPLFRRDLSRLGLVGLAMQAIGALFMFNGTPISPLVILVTISFSLVFYQFALLPFLQRQTNEPAVGGDELLPGSVGTVVSGLNPVGTVNVLSEVWTAYSDEPIGIGERVVVIAKEGLRLYVERAKPKSSRRADHLRREELADDGELRTSLDKLDVDFLDLPARQAYVGKDS